MEDGRTGEREGEGEGEVHSSRSQAPGTWAVLVRAQRWRGGMGRPSWLSWEAATWRAPFAVDR